MIIGTYISIQDEWEALQVAQYSDGLHGIEDQLLTSGVLSASSLSNNKLKKII